MLTVYFSAVDFMAVTQIKMGNIGNKSTDILLCDIFKIPPHLTKHIQNCETFMCIYNVI